MREYIMTLMTMSVVCGIIGVLSPKEDIGKYISLVCGICALVIIISPITELLRKAERLPDLLDDELGAYEEGFYESAFENSVVEGSVRQAEGILKDKLSRELNIDPESFDITLTVEKGQSSLSVKRATVIIYPQGIVIDAKEVIEYIENEIRCTCVVIYE